MFYVRPDDCNNIYIYIYVDHVLPYGHKHHSNKCSRAVVSAASVTCYCYDKWQYVYVDHVLPYGHKYHSNKYPRAVVTAAPVTEGY